MDKQEFLLIIPGIIYGVAMVDLLKIFQHRKNYIEMVGWGLFVITLVIFTWIELYNKLEVITSSNLSFFLIIGQSILLSQVASVITPEILDKDTEAYFLRNRKTFFYLLIASSIFGEILRYILYDDHSPSWLRPFAIVMYLAAAFSNKFWVRMIILIMTLKH